MTPAMYFGIRYAVRHVDADPDLAGLLITGTGDVFAPGGDMGGGDGSDNWLTFGSALGMDVTPFETLRQSVKPVVSAVNGLCQGGGLQIALCSDMTVVSDRATFRVPELLRGIADTYYSQMLARLIGPVRTRDLMFTGRTLTAAEAQEWGMVARVVPHDELLDAARDVLGQCCRTAPAARSMVKSSLDNYMGLFDRIGMQASYSSPEALEGFRAFKERRSPDWVHPDLRTGSTLSDLCASRSGERSSMHTNRSGLNTESAVLFCSCRRSTHSDALSRFGYALSDPTRAEILLMLRDGAGLSVRPRRQDRGVAADPVQPPGVPARLRTGGRRSPRAAAAATSWPISGSRMRSTTWSAWCWPSTRPAAPPPKPTPAADDRARSGRGAQYCTRRIRLLVAATITYNVIEAVVALAEGTRVSSSALIGFGLDSVIEVSSAAAVAWQFSAKDPETPGEGRAAVHRVLVLRARRIRRRRRGAARCSASARRGRR